MVPREGSAGSQVTFIWPFACSPLKPNQTTQNESETLTGSPMLSTPYFVNSKGNKRIIQLSMMVVFSKTGFSFTT